MDDRIRHSLDSTSNIIVVDFSAIFEDFVNVIFDDDVFRIVIIVVEASFFQFLFQTNRNLDVGDLHVASSKTDYCDISTTDYCGVFKDEDVDETLGADDDDDDDDGDIRRGDSRVVFLGDFLHKRRIVFSYVVICECICEFFFFRD